MDTSKNDFLPQGYKEPAGNYYKFVEGENRFRILSSAIVGWEYWNEDSEGNRKPIRKRMEEELVMEEIQEPDKVRHFWAFVVWSYKDEKIQILQITQKGIKRSLAALSRSKAWGSPVNSYDIVVTREGKDKKTQYTIQPNPKEPTKKEILEAYKRMPVDLEKLFSAEDPFKKNEEEVNVEEISKKI